MSIPWVYWRGEKSAGGKFLILPEDKQGSPDNIQESKTVKREKKTTNKIPKEDGGALDVDDCWQHVWGWGEGFSRKTQNGWHNTSRKGYTWSTQNVKSAMIIKSHRFKSIKDNWGATRAVLTGRPFNLSTLETNRAGEEIGCKLLRCCALLPAANSELLQNATSSILVID